MPEPPPLSLSLSLTDVRAWAGKTLATSADDGEVAGWVARHVARLGGTVRSHVDEGRVMVVWTPDARRRPGPDEVVAWLKAGQVHEAVVVLELLLGAMPNDEGILYNLGMARSDLGDLTRAEDLLRQCLEINPGHTNARVALGVVLLRQGRTNDAAPILERAVTDAP